MGSLAIPQVFGMLPVKILTQVVGVAMISGIVRLFRRGVAVPYCFFAIVSSAMLIVWHFPPNERFVLPLCPLLLAGLLAELEHLTQLIKGAFHHKDVGQRVAASGMAVVLGAIVVAALLVQFFMSFEYLYDSAQQYRMKLVDMRAAYTWIAANVPDSSKVLSNDDPILYLYSGRRGHVVPLVPRSWYADDHASTVAAYRDIAAYCRAQGFEYFYSNTDDTSRWTSDPAEIQSVRQAVHENPELTPLFAYGFGTVYKVANLPQPIAATR
jgi:hypothetical protein